MRVHHRASLPRRHLARAATVGKATWKHQSRPPAFDFHPPFSIQSRSFQPRTVATVGNTSPVHQPVPCGEGDLVVNPASSPRLGDSVLYYHSNGTTPLFSHNSSRSFPFGVSQMSRQSETVNTRCSSISCTQSERRWISYKKGGLFVSCRRSLIQRSASDSNSTVQTSACGLLQPTNTEVEAGLRDASVQQNEGIMASRTRYGPSSLTWVG